MVVPEARIRGIPVIGSKRGGLPEAVGEGDICLPFDAPPDDWAKAVAKYATLEEWLAARGALAPLHANRPAMRHENRLMAWGAVLGEALQPAAE